MVAGVPLAPRSDAQEVLGQTLIGLAQREPPGAFGSRELSARQFGLAPSEFGIRDPRHGAQVPETTAKMRSISRRRSRNTRVSESATGGISDAVRGSRACVALGVALAAFVSMTATSAAAPTFTARGSVEQVYVRGLAPGAQVSLVNSAGGTVATRQANSLGGTLFRNVAPGSGYQVRPAGGGEASGPLTVLSTQPAPPSATRTSRPAATAT
jgi:hypothetical protein